MQQDQTDEIYKKLRRSILRGEIPVEKPVSQVKLAKELGVSRTPLREALRMLKNEGLVASEMNRRFRVPGLNAHSFDELYAMRITLEAIAVGLTLDDLSREDIEHLRATLDFMKQSTNLSRSASFENYEIHHSEFHFCLIKGAGCQLVKTVLKLRDHTDRYRRAFYMEGLVSADEIHLEHLALFRACEARDRGALSIGIARHYGVTALSMINSFQPDYKPRATNAALRQLNLDPKKMVRGFTPVG